MTDEPTLTQASSGDADVEPASTISEEPHAKPTGQGIAAHPTGERQAEQNREDEPPA
ncbi:MAG: hypothetical protein ABIW84_07640 [Ilumatobacteraceae bacterium]